MEHQRSIMVPLRRLKRYTKLAAEFAPTDAATSILDLTYLRHTQCWYVRGRVRPHVDNDFPPYSYLLILRCDDPETALKQHGMDDLTLRCGMVVELNAHRRHSLTQAKASFLVWSPIESRRQLDMEDAVEHCIKRLRTGGFAELAY